jgi:hypothetical protein
LAERPYGRRTHALPEKQLGAGTGPPLRHSATYPRRHDSRACDTLKRMCRKNVALPLGSLLCRCCLLPLSGGKPASREPRGVGSAAHGIRRSPGLCVESALSSGTLPRPNRGFPPAKLGAFFALQAEASGWMDTNLVLGPSGEACPASQLRAALRAGSPYCRSVASSPYVVSCARNGGQMGRSHGSRRKGLPLCVRVSIRRVLAMIVADRRRAPGETTVMYGDPARIPRWDAT